MQGNKIIMSSALATITAVLGACYGTMDSAAETTDPVGESVQLVTKKREWLKNYDVHCNACFEAFELCEKGAVDALEEDACQVAMDACVRGGLIKDDAVKEDDAGVVEVDEDAAVEEDEEVDEDADVDEEADEELVDEDAEVDEDVDEKVDAGIDEEDEEVDEDAGEEVDEEDVDEEVVIDDADAAKKQLFVDIEACLVEARACVDADAADAVECVDAVQVCVQTAIDTALDVICAEQLENLKSRKASRDGQRKVLNLCQQDLQV